MKVSYGLDQTQTQAIAGCAAGAVQTDEAFQHLVPLTGGNTRAVVTNRQTDIVLTAA